jgi:ketosteroid isomerase-like protein
MKRTFWVVAFLAPAFGCAPQTPAVDHEAEKQALVSAAKAYHEAGQALDVEKIVSFYTAESRTLPPNAPSEIGSDGFRKIASAMVALPSAQFQFGEVEAEVSTGADMGYTLADIEFSFQDPQGATVQEKFRDFHLWKKDATGSWKVAVDIWNSPEPAPPAQ